MKCFRSGPESQISRVKKVAKKSTKVQRWKAGRFLGESVTSETKLDASNVPALLISKHCANGEFVVWVP